MKAVIVVPRRSEWWRDRLWDWCRPVWESLPYPLLEVEHTQGLFNRSWCANEGARRAGEWDVLLLVDADVVTERAVSLSAVETAWETGRYTVAGNERYALSQRSTERLLQGFPQSRWPELRWDRCDRHRPDCGVSKHDYNSHAVAIRRDLWEEAGGFDERFEGWGHEDGAFLAACETFRPGIERIPGRLLHLWHERAPERSRIHPRYGMNRDLRRRYTEAYGDPEAMRALIEERMATV